MRLLVAGLVLCVCLFVEVQASAFYEPVREHPDHPGKCQYKELAIAVDETVTQHSSCTKLTCRKRSSGVGKGQSPYGVEGYGCNHASSWPENCYLEVPDLTKDFPDCCPQLECDGPPEGGISLVG